eukprot:CAMPEP_0179236354 /NCGR_PEP_ID=MMETSP0797-20121207/13884_1 /TAXON_ID=47934 /ORGANISM="Dinophysis acuminata, Strain DAEP01" /LENGTH=97 /DNA_ID=CAMNT_0020943607 /DNA_START=481 /DNA_END=773 /DNA_ORIENTATION=-
MWQGSSALALAFERSHALHSNRQFAKLRDDVAPCGLGGRRHRALLFRAHCHGEGQEPRAQAEAQEHVRHGGGWGAGAVQGARRGRRRAGAKAAANIE